MIHRYDNMSDLTDCPIDRPHNGTGGHQNEGMLLVNHWLQQNVSGILIPDRCNAIITNSEKFINGHVQSCQRTLEKTPVLVLVSRIGRDLVGARTLLMCACSSSIGSMLEML